MYRGKERRTQTHVVVAFVLQSPAERLSDACEIGHWLVAHRLGDEVPVFLRGARHSDSVGPGWVISDDCTAKSL